jgi:hypothetical protein
MSRYNPLDLFGTAASSSSSIANGSSAGGGSSSSSTHGSSDSNAVATAAAAAASCSEVLARQQAALAALLECPYNNLKVRCSENVLMYPTTLSINHFDEYISCPEPIMLFHVLCMSTSAALRCIEALAKQQAAT